jgi:ribose 5-phosphate isomerase A
MTASKEQILKMKQDSAKEALKFVKNGMILGIGSGSTVREFIKLLNKSEIDSKSIICIPSSFDTEQMLIENGMIVGRLNQYPIIDLTIDGADRVDKDLNVIKGGGGALLREKIIAAASKVVIIIVDDTKIVQSLDGSFPIPVEVIPHAKEYVKKQLEKMQGKPSIRKASDKLGPTITDNGNIILDTDFQKIKNISNLEKTLNNIPGVMENGLFPNALISRVIIASSKKIDIREKE